ncbi:substrate-binding and VWA domain-containing protein [Ornithinibacter aureus]|uniref:Substrate-binding and VWA domain-containing protein n=1 Tax=Ornithinibacter aureus TaxID=622664 RepID=A0ABP8JRA3_9MICO|nr:Ca-activated chloride channel family protein [Ornithinibacter aureus]
MAGILVLAVGGGYAVQRLVSDDGAAQAAGAPCDPATLSVVADPAIARALTTATAGLAPGADGCVSVTVTSQPSTTTAAEIARAEGTGLGGSLPDVWVPDSSLWVEKAKATPVGATRLTGDATTVATTPVVIALARSTATELGWPDTQPRWAELAAGSPGIASGSPDPQESAAGLAALLAQTDGRSTPEAVAEVSQRLTVPQAGGRTPAQLVADGTYDAMPTTELDVLTAQTAAGVRGSVVAAYDPALGPALDFPMLLLTTKEGPDTARATAYAALVRALDTDAARQALTEAGLRTPEGELDDSFGAELGVAEGDLVDGERPDGAQVTAALDSWALAGRRSRLLVVVDRSGSMRHPIPGGSIAKSTLAQDSLRRLVGSAAPDSDLGLWSFTTNSPGDDIQALVPLGRLDATVGSVPRREALTTAIGTLTPSLQGDTPLHRAVIASYASAQQDYAYGRLNAVVIVTDGVNDDPGQSISEAAVLSQLRQLYDPMRPVRIITLGYGPEPDLASLQRMADVTGGQAFKGLTEQEASTLLATTLAKL